MSRNENMELILKYDRYPISIANLMEKYPEAPIVTVEQVVDEFAFEDQRKRTECQIEGGAIGIITTADNKFVLTKRTKPHPGWALPGGGVEQGEMFDDALIREVAEECGIEVNIIDLVLVEDKKIISPKQETLQFWLAVFQGIVVSDIAPFQTEKAVKEGLEIAVFAFEDLPPEMVLKDREKLLQSFNK